jgi:hypothetical protein
MLVQITIRHGMKTCGFAARYAERLRLSVVEATFKPHPRPDASGRGWVEKMGAMGRKGEAFPHSRGRSPHEQQERLLIWTAVNQK